MMTGKRPRQCTLTSLWARYPRFNDTSGAELAVLPHDDDISDHYIFLYSKCSLLLLFFFFLL